MKIEGAVVVVTGGAGGIGRALVAALVEKGAAAIVVHDRDLAATQAIVNAHVSAKTELVAMSGDVSDERAIADLVEKTESRFDHMDLFCSNAGMLVNGGIDAANEAWTRSFAVNVMAHVFAARAALPKMLARGHGYFLNVASAAGMLTAPGAAPYATTKHAAVGFSEWLAIEYGARGIGVSLLCPEAVATPMLTQSLASGNAGVRRIAETGVTLAPDAIARVALEGVEANRFLILSHPDTLKNTQRKWSDVDRWIGSMTRFLKSVNA